MTHVHMRITVGVKYVTVHTKAKGKLVKYVTVPMFNTWDVGQLVVVYTSARWQFYNVPR